MLKFSLAFIPLGASLLLLRYFFDADIRNFIPAYDIDQYYYVREARTFAAAAFDGGYYGSNGLTAMIGRYGPHGLAYPLVYGGLASLLGGWRDWLAPALNLAFVTAALLCMAARLSLGRQGALACLFVVFSPILIYLPLGYQEAPQCALALALAGPLAALVGAPKAKPAGKGLLLWTLAAIFAASLTRPTWAVLFPAAVFCAGQGRPRDAFWALGLGAGLLAAAYAAFSLTASPWDVQAGVSLLASLLRGDPGPLLSRLGPNLASLLNFTDNRHHSLNLLVMLGGAGLAALPALAGAGQARRRLAGLHACNMLLPCLAYVTIYNGTGYQLTRLLSAHFLLSLALVLRTAPPGAARLAFGPVLAACLGLLPASLGHYALFVRPAYDDYRGDGARIAALAREIDPILRLGEAAGQPWRRTLGAMHDNVVVPALAAPGAYGIQVYSPKGLLLPLRAGFVLLSPEEGAVAGRRTPLTPLLATPYGILYRNDEAFGLTARPEAAP